MDGVTLQEIRQCIEEYRRQFDQRQQELAELERQYLATKNQLTTTMAMCSGAIAAFEHLAEGKVVVVSDVPPQETYRDVDAVDHNG